MPHTPEPYDHEQWYDNGFELQPRWTAPAIKPLAHKSTEPNQLLSDRGIRLGGMPGLRKHMGLGLVALALTCLVLATLGTSSVSAGFGQFVLQVVVLYWILTLFRFIKIIVLAIIVVGFISAWAGLALLYQLII